MVSGKKTTIPNFTKTIRLNPSYTGKWSRGYTIDEVEVWIISLNPSYTGKWSRGFSLFSEKTNLDGRLNPSYSGKRSRGEHQKTFRVCGHGVLTLLILENGLGVVKGN